MSAADFVIVMQPPTGPAEYWPKGFGYTCHAHTLDRDAAEGHATEALAWRRANGYRWPDAFWESERRHKAEMERQFRDWRFTVEPRAVLA